jgi:hypothetical protein
MTDGLDNCVNAVPNNEIPVWFITRAANGRGRNLAEMVLGHGNRVKATAA